jgi:hypothetical protein
MSTIKLKDLDKANFSTVNYIPEINVLCRRIEAMFPEDDKGILVVEAKVAIPKLTLGEIAKLMNAQPKVTNFEIAGTSFKSMAEHSLQITCGSATVEVYCIAG